MIFILDQTNTGLRYHWGYGWFPNTYLTNILSDYKTYELTRQPWQGKYKHSSLQITLWPCHQACDLASRPLDPDTILLISKNSVSKPKNSKIETFRIASPSSKGMQPRHLNVMKHTLVEHVVNMSAKYWQNVQMSMILEKLCCFASFCLKQTQNLHVKPVSGGEPRADPSSQRQADFQRIFWKFTSTPCKKLKLILFIVFSLILSIVYYYINVFILFY